MSDPIHSEATFAESGVTRRDVEALKLVLIRTEHARRCEGFYRCTCFVGVAEKAVEKIEEALRG